MFHRQPEKKRLVRIIGQEILYNPKTVVVKITKTAKKGHHSGPAGKTGGFDIEKQKSCRVINPIISAGDKMPATVEIGAQVFVDIFNSGIRKKVDIVNDPKDTETVLFNYLGVDNLSQRPQVVLGGSRIARKFQKAIKGLQSSPFNKRFLSLR